MLDAAAIARIQAKASHDLASWLEDHVDPVLGQIQAHFSGSPLDDVERAAILDKCLTPLVYWVRDQPLTATTSPAAHPVPAPVGASPQVSQPGGSLSQLADFKQKYGLIGYNEGKGWETIRPSGFLGKDFNTVNKQLKDWGYHSVERHEDGKRVWEWEKRVNP